MSASLEGIRLSPTYNKNYEHVRDVLVGRDAESKAKGDIDSPACEHFDMSAIDIIEGNDPVYSCEHDCLDVTVPSWQADALELWAKRHNLNVTEGW